MAGKGLPKEIRRRKYTFARRVASPFSDSRRAGFIEDMISGLIVSGHVHSCKIARAMSTGDTNIHGVEKKLSRHLASEHWNMSPVDDFLLQRSAAMIGEDTLIPADLTDVAKPWARKMDGLGRVHDGSDPQKGIKPGYMMLEAYVRVGRWRSDYPKHGVAESADVQDVRTTRSRYALGQTEFDGAECAAGQAASMVRTGLASKGSRHPESSVRSEICKPRVAAPQGMKELVLVEFPDKLIVDSKCG